MTDSNRLDFAKPSVTVDLVLMSVRDGRLVVLLQRREGEPEAGKWALPGGFVGIDETLEAAAERILAAKARMDPTGSSSSTRSVTWPRSADARHHRRLFRAARCRTASPRHLNGPPDLTPAAILVPWTGETGGPVEARDADGAALPLAFDHAEILGLAMKRLRGKLDYSAVGFALLPPTLHAAPAAGGARGDPRRALNKPAFRRRMLDKGWLAADRKRGRPAPAYRPAELYRSIVRSLT